MENINTITHSLSLVLKILDKATNNEITSSGVQIKKDGKNMSYIRKGDGTYVFLNMPKKDFVLSIKVFGYEEQEVSVIYENLDYKLPILEVYLESKQPLN